MHRAHSTLQGTSLTARPIVCVSSFSVRIVRPDLLAGDALLWARRSSSRCQCKHAWCPRAGCKSRAPILTALLLFLFGDRCCAIHSLALLQMSSGKCYLLKGTDAKGCPIVVVHVRRHLPSKVPPRLHFQDGSLIVVIKRNLLASIALALHSLSERAGL